MVGGIVFPAWSEAFGRKKLYILSTALFSVFCVIIAAVPFLAAATVGRFFCGFFSAIPAIVVADSIKDIYNAKDRVWMIFVWAIVANMGLALGPIMGVYITAYMGWLVELLHTLQSNHRRG